MVLNSIRDELFHCTDCDLTVHENDKENHLNGGRHKYRIRHQVHTDNTDNKTAQFYCDVCDTEFTDIHFFTIHKGSKTHKRNLKRLNKRNVRKASLDLQNKELEVANVPGEIKPIGRRLPLQGNDFISIHDFKDISDYKNTREKYRYRNTRNPEGNTKAYVHSVTAFWAASLAMDPNVIDFKISVNDKEWGDFGDAVVEINMRESNEHDNVKTTFAIEFRDVTTNSRNIDSFAEGRFALPKLFTQLNTVKLGKEVENLKFVVFTTALADPKLEKQIKLSSDVIHKLKQDCDNCKGEALYYPVVTKTLGNRQKLFVNTSDDNNNIFFFFCTDKIHKLPKIYVYTHQERQKHFGILINELISSSIYGDRKVDIHREFIRYIETWSEGYLGGSYRLKKEDVLVKIAHLLLYSYKIPPVVRTTEKQNYDIWRRTVFSIDVTIFKQHPILKHKLCEPLNLKIETELGLKIDTTTCSIDLNPKNIENIENTVLKMYLFEETMGDIQDDIPLEIVYDFFWKAGLIPIMLEVHNVKEQEHVLNVIYLMKALGLTRRYFLITDDDNIKSTLKYYKTLSFFVTVDDIIKRIPSFLFDYVQFKITDNFSLSLNTIQEYDPFFQKTINPHEFFDMTLGRYSFKCFSNTLARKYGLETQLVLEDDLMVKLREEIVSKTESKMAFMEQGLGKNKSFLKGVRPNLFCD